MMKGRALGKPQHGEYLSFAAAERTDEVDAVLVGRVQSGDRVDHHRKESHQRRRHDLGRHAEAEPENEQRRERDLRHRLEHDDVRVDEVGETPVERDGHSKCEAEGSAKRKAGEHLEQRHRAVIEIEPVGQAAPQPFGHGGCRRQDERGDLEKNRACLPDDEHEAQQQDAQNSILGGVERGEVGHQSMNSSCAEMSADTADVLAKRRRGHHVERPLARKVDVEHLRDAARAGASSQRPCRRETRPRRSNG